MRTLVITAAILGITCSGAWAQIYRWMDEEGKVHYSKTPPPPGAKNVQRKDWGAGGTGEASSLPYATQLAAKNFPVILRTSPECGVPCAQARAALVKRGVPFTEFSVVSQEDLDELKKLSGRDQLPHLIVGSQMQSGFRDDLYDELLDTAGYPPSGPLLPIDALRKMAPPPEPPKTQTRQGGDAGAPQQPGANQ